MAETSEPNHCLVSLLNNADVPVFFKVRYEDCVECLFFTPITRAVVPNELFNITVLTPFSYVFAVSASHLPDHHLCNTSLQFGEYGIYEYKINRTNTGAYKCHNRITKEPVSKLSTIDGICIAIAALIFWYTLAIFLRSIFKRKSEPFTTTKIRRDEEEPLDNVNETKEVQEKRDSSCRRMKSLDAFRGLTVLLMVFVNVGGGQFYLFTHTTWDGLTFADIVQPWFLWIVGCSIALAHNAQWKDLPFWSYSPRIAKRCFLLTLLGFLLNSELFGNKLSTLRYLGVLQKIAICYGTVALLQIFFYPSKENERVKRRSVLLSAIWNTVRDSSIQWLFCISLVLIHVYVVLFLHVPSCGSGYLGPGGWHKLGVYKECGGGASAYVDKLILGESHMVKNFPFTMMYGYATIIEPDGIISMCTAIFQTFLGLQAGQYFVRYKHKTVTQVYLIYGFLSGYVGYALCNGIQNNGILPCNKLLNSLSYILVTSSFAFFVLVVLYVLIDVMEKWDGTPFNYLGANSLFLLIAPVWTRRLIPFEWAVQSHKEHLVVDLWHTSLWVAITVILYQKKIILAV